jgi:hypothetical protein
MPIYVGTEELTSIGQIKIGTENITKVMLGTEQIWPAIGTVSGRWLLHFKKHSNVDTQRGYLASDADNQTGDWPGEIMFWMYINQGGDGRVFGTNYQYDLIFDTGRFTLQIGRDQGADRLFHLFNDFTPALEYERWYRVRLHQTSWWRHPDNEYPMMAHYLTVWNQGLGDPLYTYWVEDAYWVLESYNMWFGSSLVYSEPVNGIDGYLANVRFYTNPQGDQGSHFYPADDPPTDPGDPPETPPTYSTIWRDTGDGDADGIIDHRPEALADEDLQAEWIQADVPETVEEEYPETRAGEKHPSAP